MVWVGFRHLAAEDTGRRSFERSERLSRMATEFLLRPSVEPVAAEPGDDARVHCCIHFRLYEMTQILAIFCKVILEAKQHGHDETRAVYENNDPG